MYTLPKSNDFIESLMQLSNTSHQSNNWTTGVVLGFENHNFDQLPYFQTQVFEPSILFELSRFTNISLNKIENLDYSLTGNNIKILKWLLDNLKYVTPVQKLNLSYALSSIGRYKLADSVFNQIIPSQLLHHERVYYYFQKFVIKNRTGQGHNCQEEFMYIKEILENNSLSVGTYIFFSAQAIVGYQKSKFITEDLYQWYLNVGLVSVEKIKNTNSFGEIHALSNFYRAYAMVPAEKGDIKKTRELMEKCFYYANCLEVNNEMTEVIKTDVLKTYYESTIKEQMYITKDLEKAEEAAQKLVSLDPNWSISHQELGDVYYQQGYLQKALEEYKTSKTLLLPRYSIALFKEANCLEKMGETYQAIEVYKDLLKFDSLNISAGINGLKLSKDIENKESILFFKNYTSNWYNIEGLPKEYKEALV